MTTAYARLVGPLAEAALKRKLKLYHHLLLIVEARLAALLIIGGASTSPAAGLTPDVRLGATPWVKCPKEAHRKALPAFHVVISTLAMAKKGQSLPRHKDGLHEEDADSLDWHRVLARMERDRPNLERLRRETEAGKEPDWHLKGGRIVFGSPSGLPQLKDRVKDLARRLVAVTLPALTERRSLRFPVRKVGRAVRAAPITLTVGRWALIDRSRRERAREEAARRVLGALVSSRGDISTDEVRRLTGLLPIEVDLSLEQLERQGYVMRPEADGPLELNTDTNVAIGVSILHDRIIGVTTNLRGEPLDSVELHHDHISTSVPMPAEVLVDEVANLVDDLVARRRPFAVDIIGVGVDIAGHADALLGLVYYCPALGWQQEVPLGEMLEKRLAIPVIVDNDASALAIHERLFGVGRGVNDFLLVLISEDGNGIGSAIVSGGRILRGSTGGAGELGHTFAGFGQGRTCRCGGVGHLEAEIGLDRLLELYAEEQPRHECSTLADLSRVLRGDGDYRQDQAKAARVVSWAGTMLGRAVASQVKVLDPACVLLIGPDELLFDGEGNLSTLADSFWGSVRFTSAPNTTRLSMPDRMATRSLTDTFFGAQGAAATAIATFAVTPPASKAALEGRDDSEGALATAWY